MRRTAPKLSSIVSAVRLPGRLTSTAATATISGGCAVNGRRRRRSGDRDGLSSGCRHRSGCRLTCVVMIPFIELIIVVLKVVVLAVADIVLLGRA